MKASGAARIELYQCKQPYIVNQEKLFDTLWPLILRNSSPLDWTLVIGNKNVTKILKSIYNNRDQRDQGQVFGSTIIHTL